MSTDWHCAYFRLPYPSFPPALELRTAVERRGPADGYRRRSAPSYAARVMTLDELEHHEQVVLLSLLGLMARLDLNASADEVDLLHRVTDELGEERLQSVLDDARQLQDQHAIMAAAANVIRPEAREVVYELLYDMAIMETIVKAEGDLLDQLADLWGLPRRMGAGR